MYFLLMGFAPMWAVESMLQEKKSGPKCFAPMWAVERELPWLIMPWTGFAPMWAVESQPKTKS